MTFSQLEIYAILAETKGFTATAKRLGITQPAVSHALKSLETELGVALFERRGAHVEITQIGARLLEHAREILGLSETMQQEAAGFRGVQLGVLRIGSFGATSSLQLLPHLLEAFGQEHPGIDVLVEEAADEEVIRWIETRRVDVGFVVLPDDRFRTFALTSDQFVALVPAGSPLAQRPRLRLDELCDAPFIMPESGSAQIISRLFSEANLRPNIRYRTSQILSTLTMVERGQGISVVADLVLPRTTPQDGWVCKPLDPVRTRAIGLAIHRRAAISPALRAFITTAERLSAQNA